MVPVGALTVVAAITDAHALLEHLMKTRPDGILALLKDLAQQDVNNGVAVPGVTTEIQAVVR